MNHQDQYLPSCLPVFSLYILDCAKFEWKYAKKFVKIVKVLNLNEMMTQKQETCY